MQHTLSGQIWRKGGEPGSWAEMVEQKGQFDPYFDSQSGTNLEGKVTGPKFIKAVNRLKAFNNNDLGVLVYIIKIIGPSYYIRHLQEVSICATFWAFGLRTWRMAGRRKG